MFQSEPKFDTYDYAIGGKMVVGRATMTDSYKLMVEDGDKEAVDRLKSDLIHQMAQFILENKLVEFTHYDDPITFNRQVAVRAYLAPDSQVKILRTVNKII
jgi:hypothetical protein